jgi:NTE family protein
MSETACSERMPLGDRTRSCAPVTVLLYFEALPGVVRGIAVLGQVTALCIVLLLTACSTFHPWTNSPVSAPMAFERAAPTEERPMVVVVALSGGGARAGAFGLGVLRELKATEFTLHGGRTTLLDQVNLISGVSGGSILAAHFAAFGDESLVRFETDFLLQDFQASIVRSALSPVGVFKLSSPWYGRGHVLADRLDELYQGRTYADVIDRPHAPELLVTATDLTTGAPFEFTPEQFGLICADLRSVPLSFAVAASSSVPVLLAPVTVRNFAGTCESQPALPNPTADNYRARLLRSSTQSYLSAQQRPYIHLVDGGVADNLGVRTVLDRLIANGSLSATFGAVAPGSIRKVVIVAVNSERGLIEQIDESDRVPTTPQVLGALIFGAATRLTQTTLAMMKDDVQQWHREIAEQRGKPGSPFAADAELYLINVSLKDVPGADRGLLGIPTAFTIEAERVRDLIEAGHEVLRRSSEFQRLRASLANDATDRAATAAFE